MRAVSLRRVEEGRAMLERWSSLPQLRRIGRWMLRFARGADRTAVVRFLGRNRRIGTSTAGAIDEFFPVVGEPGLVSRRSAIDIVAGEPVYVRGWAIDETRRALGWDIRFEIDGEPAAAQLKSDQPRPDIVAFYGASELLASGFEAVVSTCGLGIGPHELGVRVTVGRRGAAFATIPVRKQFFVHATTAPAVLPSARRGPARWFVLDPTLPAPLGGMLALSGWALDRRRRAYAELAGRIDAGPWHAGWTGVERPELAARAGQRRRPRGGFGLRLPLAGVAPGSHRIELAARSKDGRWTSLYRCPVLVCAPEAQAQSFRRNLTDGGEAAIDRVGGEERPGVRVYRVGARSAATLTGTLRRSSPIGAPLAVVARHADGSETGFHAWSAPGGEPNSVIFGATLAPGALRPGTYRLAVEAPDLSGRFVGRALTPCRLQIDADPETTTASASGIARITASSTISTSCGNR